MTESRRASRAATVCAAVAIAIGAEVLLGWILGVPAMTRIAPSLLAVKANSAVTLILLGCALVLLLRDDVGRTAKGAAVAFALVGLFWGLLALVETVAGVDLHIDQLLFKEAANAPWTAHPGRPPATASLCFSLVSAGLLALWMRRAGATQLLAVGAAVVATTSLLTFMLGASETKAFGGYYTSIPILSSLAFAALALGLMLARPHEGPLAVIAGPGVGGLSARRFAALLVLIPIATAFLIRGGRAAGLFTADYGLVLQVTVTMVLLSFALWLVAEWLDRGERALRESEDKFRYVFDSSLVGLSMTQPSGDVVTNEAFCRMLGYSAAEFRGRTWQSLTHPDDVDETEQIIAAILAGERDSARFEKRYLRKDGAVVWADVTSTLRRDADCKPLHFITAVLDITEKKRADEKLAAQAARLKVLADVSQVFAAAGEDYQVVLDEVVHEIAGLLSDSCQIRLVSDDAERLDLVAAYARDPEVSHALWEAAAQTTVGAEDPGPVGRVLRGEATFVPTVDPDELLASYPPEFRGVFERFMPRSFILVPLRVQARTIGALSLTRYRSEQPPFTEDDLNLALDLADRAALAISNARLLTRLKGEVTEHERAEEALRESVARLQRFNDSGLFGVIVWTVEGQIIDANAKFLEMVGFSREELEAGAIDWQAMTPPEYTDQDERSLAELKATGVNAKPFEKEYVRKDGSRLPIVIGGAMLDEERETGVAFVLDDSERKRAEEAWLAAEGALRRERDELERSNAELEQFAYVASHDLQEPLRMVAMYSELLGRRYKGRLDADADEFIGYAVDGALRMQALIGDLLEFSRVGTRGSLFAPTDSRAALDEALANLGPAITEAGAQVTGNGLPTVNADHQQLVRLFQNLIANAVKFRGDKPARVHVSAAHEDGVWVFAVRDNGIGLEPRYAQRIFLIFQRLHAKEDYPGTGIGLALCQRIVSRHGGKIWVKSTLGEGATFFFTLPDGDEQPQEVTKIVDQGGAS